MNRGGEQAAVVIVGKGDVRPFLQRPFDPGTEAQTVSFDVEDIDMKQTVIVIKSHARGMLNLANVIQEYSV